MKARKMAKNPPLVGHFPVCTHPRYYVRPCGLRGINVRVGRQEPAIIPKMSAEPAAAQVRGRVGITHALEQAAGEHIQQEAGP